MSAPAERWSALHHGIDPAGVPLLRGWLRAMWALARPLVALRVPPIALTLAGALLAVDALLFARRLPWLALALVVASAVCDGLDGAVAALAGRATAAGAVADKVADRVADCAFAGVVWRCGAPGWLALLLIALTLVHEGYRQWRGGVLKRRLTVAERPTRVVCAALACASFAVTGAAWPATVCGAVWAGLGAIGLAQLARTVTG